MTNKDGKNWFSNFLPYNIPLVYDGISYPSPENFYQAMKFNGENKRFREDIARYTPGRAKRAAANLKHLVRNDWFIISLDVMEYALRHRLNDPQWVAKLVANDDETLTEWNYWHDNFWGHCTCPRCANKQHLNHLGLLCRKLRDELKEAKNETVV